jgi:hypothetical protein
MMMMRVHDERWLMRLLEIVIDEVDHDEMLMTFRCIIVPVQYDDDCAMVYADDLADEYRCWVMYWWWRLTVLRAAMLLMVTRFRGGIDNESTLPQEVVKRHVYRLFPAVVL